MGQNALKRTSRLNPAASLRVFPVTLGNVNLFGTRLRLGTESDHISYLYHYIQYIYSICTQLF